MKCFDCFCTILSEICVDKVGTSVIYQVYCEYFSCCRVVGTCEQKFIIQRRGGNRWVQFWKSSNFKDAINIWKPTGNVVQVWQLSILRSVHAVFVRFVFTWEQTATCATYNINWLVFITEMKSVYCAVRTGVFKWNSLPFVFKERREFSQLNINVDKETN